VLKREPKNQFQRELGTTVRRRRLRWMQEAVMCDTAEVEYLAAFAVAVWLRELLSGLFGLRLEATYIWCDNQSCMKSSDNPVVYDRSKHTEIRYYYIKDMVQKGAVRLQFCDYRGSICGRVYQAVVEDEV
jgi:hypothetical protein